MIIQSVLTRNLYSDLHRTIYGAVDGDTYMRRALQNPPAFVDGMISMRTSNQYIRKMAVRVALMHFRKQKMLSKLIEHAGEHGADEAYVTKLNRVKSCLPLGVTREPRNNMDCEVYSVCPWCRFRKAKQIMETLHELLPQARQLSYITLTAPVMFIENPQDHHESYAAITKSLCKKRNLFVGDFVVTVPRWRPIFRAGELESFCFCLETTIIGLSEEPTELPMPEDCLSEAMREKAVFGGVGPGTWVVGRPSRKLLGMAITVPDIEGHATGPERLCSLLSQSTFQSDRKRTGTMPFGFELNARRLLLQLTRRGSMHLRRWVTLGLGH